MRFFSGVVGGGGVNFYRVLRLALFYDKALTDEAPHSAEVLSFFFFISLPKTRVLNVYRICKHLCKFKVQCFH